MLSLKSLIKVLARLSSFHFCLIVHLLKNPFIMIMKQCESGNEGTYRTAVKPAEKNKNAGCSSCVQRAPSRWRESSDDDNNCICKPLIPELIAGERDGTSCRFVIIIVTFFLFSSAFVHQTCSPRVCVIKKKWIHSWRDGRHVHPDKDGRSVFGSAAGTMAQLGSGQCYDRRVCHPPGAVRLIVCVYYPCNL